MTIELSDSDKTQTKELADAFISLVEGDRILVEEELDWSRIRQFACQQDSRHWELATERLYEKYLREFLRETSD